MSYYLQGQRPLSGSMGAHPSKSHSVRAVLFASFAEGTSRLANLLSSPDVEAMVDACRQLGAHIEYSKGTTTIEGVGFRPKLPSSMIDVQGSGLVLRYIGALGALAGGPVTLSGDRSVRERRHVSPLVQGLCQRGAHVQTATGCHPPMCVEGPVSPGLVEIDGSDSQPVTALLLLLSLLDGPSEMFVTNPGETPWVDLSLDWMERFGCKVTRAGYTHYWIEGSARWSGFDYSIPGDFSTITFPMAAAILTDSCVTFTGLDFKDVQGDKAVIDVLQQMGAKIERKTDSVIVLGKGELVGIEIDVNPVIDALPLLAVMGCFCKGTTRLYNAAIARQKESDRLHAITCELRKMGADIEEYEDELVIHSSQLHGSDLASHEDHRIAMALSVAAMATPGSSTIKNISCIDKTFRGFDQAMRRLGASIQTECPLPEGVLQ